MSTYHLLATGSNSNAQLGLSHTNDISSFASCVFLDQDGVDPLRTGWKPIRLTSGSGHSLILLQPPIDKLGVENQVWGCGSNDFGQLGGEKMVVGWQRLDLKALMIGEDSTASVTVSEKVLGRDRRRSDHKTKPPPRTPPHHSQFDQRVIYQPTEIACSWTTSFIVLSRYLSPLPSSPSSSSTPNSQFAQPRRLPDIILSFGANDFSELGISHPPLPSASSCCSPTASVSQVQLPPAKEGEIHIVKSLRASQRSVVCLLDVWESGPDQDDGNRDRHLKNNPIKQLVLGWGSSRHGQLSSSSSSLPTIEPTLTPAGPSVPKLINNKQPRLSSPKSPSPYPPVMSRPTRIDLQPAPEAGDEKVKSVALGSSHSVFLLDTGQVIGLGSNVKDQLSRLKEDFVGRGVGIGEQKGDVAIKRYKAIGCTWNSTFLVQPRLDPAKGDAVISMGSNTHGQLGLGDSTLGVRRGEVDLRDDAIKVSKVICGSEHVLLLHRVLSSSSARDVLEPIRLKVWGWNEHGNLGLGDVVDRWKPVDVTLENILRRKEGTNPWAIEDCWAGCGTSWILVKSQD